MLMTLIMQYLIEGYIDRGIAVDKQLKIYLWSLSAPF